MDEVDNEPTSDEVDGGPTEVEPEFEPAGFERWRRESALGTVGTGIARGLQNVFGVQQDEIVMVAPVPGGPPDPDRLQVILDPDDPTKSVAVLPAHGQAHAADAAADADADADDHPG
jgi:hypothetical protein